MKPTPLSDLAELENKFPIICVEGKLIEFFSKPSTGGSGEKTWTRYDGTLSDGKLEHRVSFWMDSVPACVRKGSSIRIVHGKDKHDKPAGLSMSDRTSGGKNYRSITVDDRAIITLAGGDSTTPEDSSAPQSQSTHQDALQRSSGPSGGRSAGHDNSPVDVRVAQYLKIAKVVCEQTGKDWDEFTSSMTNEDIRSITTGISMTYRGDYGAYAPPVFGGVQTLADAPEHTWEGDKPTKKAPVPSWKTFPHPKKKHPDGRVITLGEFDDEKFLAYASWAYTAHPGQGDEDRETRAFQANVLMGATEKGLTPQRVFLDVFAGKEGCGDTFTLDDLEAVIGAEYSMASKNLGQDKWLELLNHMDKTIAACKSNHLEGEDESGIPY